MYYIRIVVAFSHSPRFFSNSPLLPPCVSQDPLLLHNTHSFCFPSSRAGTPLRTTSWNRADIGEFITCYTHVNGFLFLRAQIHIHNHISYPYPHHIHIHIQECTHHSIPSLPLSFSEKSESRAPPSQVVRNRVTISEQQGKAT